MICKKVYNFNPMGKTELPLFSTYKLLCMRSFHLKAAWFKKYMWGKDAFKK